MIFQYFSTISLLKPNFHTNSCIFIEEIYVFTIFFYIPIFPFSILSIYSSNITLDLRLNPHFCNDNMSLFFHTQIIYILLAYKRESLTDWKWNCCCCCNYVCVVCWTEIKDNDPKQFIILGFFLCVQLFKQNEPQLPKKTVCIF